MSYGTPPPPPPGSPYGQAPYGQAVGQPTGDPGTLDLPWYGIGFVDALKRMFQKYARFDGRASRSEYWWSYLGVMLLWIPLYVLLLIGSASHSTALTALSGLLFVAAALGLIVPAIAIAVRRLHDAGLSGWLYLLGLVPCIGLVVVVLLCLPSKPEGAKYDRRTL